jgi:hypothetical protein
MRLKKEIQGSKLKQLSPSRAQGLSDQNATPSRTLSAQFTINTPVTKLGNEKKPICKQQRSYSLETNLSVEDMENYSSSQMVRLQLCDLSPGKSSGALHICFMGLCSVVEWKLYAACDVIKNFYILFMIHNTDFWYLFFLFYSVIHSVLHFSVLCTFPRSSVTPSHILHCSK